MAHTEHGILITMTLLVLWRFPAAGVGICSKGNTEDNEINLNLSTAVSGEVCCCSYTVAMDTQCTNLSSFIEYDCSINVSLEYPPIPACGAVGSWSSGCVTDTNKDYSICVSRATSGPVQLGTIRLKSEALVNLTCNYSEPQRTSTPPVTTTPEDNTLTDGAIIGIVVSVSVVIVAVVCLVLARVKLKAKNQDRDNISTIHADSLFGDDGNDVIMPTTTHAKRGADNSGYYQGAAAKKTGVRVPKKQLLRVDTYLKDQNGKSPFGQVPKTSKTNKEEANFVY
ncbi:uncharacterized protein [Haliotis cracherodii]|uniref:uncharacterized protein n=1 Tax=Haliotis cracherodii TaxID=6455 RepID=UPI0039E9111E